MATYSIAVVKGDGIGPEVCAAAMDVIEGALDSASRLEFREYPAGAEHYLKTGTAFPEETFEGFRSADAILHGAAGLPGVLLPDGTEAGPDFGLKIRSRLDLYANVRPIRLWPGLSASHGSAPDIMGQGIANPLGTILAGALMLRWLGERQMDLSLGQGAARIERAVETVLSAGRILTQDLGGRATTVEMTRAVCEALR